MATTAFLEQARATLQRSELPQYLVEQRSLTAELRPLYREISRARHQVRLNDSVPYYVDSPTPLQMRGLETRLAEKQAPLRTVDGLAASKTATCYAKSPPLEIVHRVELVIGAALWDRRVGVEPQWLTSTKFADELDRIAERVAEVWAPGVDLDEIVVTLRDSQKRWQVSARRIPGTSDPVLGWAPIDRDTLLCGAAAVLQTPAFADAERAVAQGERRVELAEEHEEADRREAGIRTGVIESMTRWLEDGPTREEQALFTAEETLFNGVDSALNAFAPLGIHAMAVAASAALRGVRGGWEHTLCPTTGALLRPRTRAMRAIVLATLVELRAACERAFPGLPALVWTGAPDRMKAALERTRGSPYRRSGAEVPDHTPPTTEQTSLFGLLEARGLEPLVARGVIHAARLGVIQRRLGDAEDLVTWADRATFWSASDRATTLKDLSERAAWHTRVLMEVETHAVRTIAQVRHGDPQVVLQSAIAKAHAALHAVHTVTGQYDMPVVVGCPEAAYALRQLAGCWSQMYGLEGDRSHLVNTLLRRLSGAPVPRPGPARLLTFSEVIETLAFHLQPTEFAALAPSVGAALVQREHLRDEFREAHLDVGIWDQINVFTESDAEERRGDVNSRLLSLGGQITAEIQRANVLLESALATYPPASLYYGIPRLMHRIAQIPAGGWNSRSEVRYGAPSIKMKKPALDALRHWTVAAIRVIGYAPTPSHVLEQFVARDLE